MSLPINPVSAVAWISGDRRPSQNTTWLARNLVHAENDAEQRLRDLAAARLEADAARRKRFRAYRIAGSMLDDTGER
ncbi:MAG: hypothetical protein JWP38_745 [Herbaspirillum sp.]|nr:hypothetical protein [Herbaspirillum sp.]